MNGGIKLSFWNFIGLANKKDFDKLSQKIVDVSEILERLTQQNSTINSSILSLEDRMNSIYESSILKVNDSVRTICELNSKSESAIIDFIKDKGEEVSNNLNDINKELDDKIIYLQDSLKLLIINADNQEKNHIEKYKCINELIEDISKSILITSEKIMSSNRELIKEQVAAITETISMTMSTIESQTKNNDDKLKSIEMLSSKLLEVTKIIWVDNMVENLNIINTK